MSSSLIAISTTPSHLSDADSDSETIFTSPARRVGDVQSGLSDGENILSSQRKPQKPPTITPRRFTRFFTPRSATSSDSRNGSLRPGRQLRDITRNGINRSGILADQGLAQLLEAEYELYHDRPRKRRRASICPSSSPPRSSPTKHLPDVANADRSGRAPNADDFTSQSFHEALNLAHCASRKDSDIFTSPIKRSPYQTLASQVLRRSFGTAHRSSAQALVCTEDTRERSTAQDFVTTPKDKHVFSGSMLPFCVTKCNTNSLMAIGQEDGGVRLLDSSKDSAFESLHVQFRPHKNAVMDIAFNNDDGLLATASGDQTTRIIDMRTQTTTSVLIGHTSSVKQVRWHPTSHHIVTTSSRDGCIMLWDTRCAEGKTVNGRMHHLAEDHVEPPIKQSTGLLRVGSSHRSDGAQATLKSSRTASVEEAMVSITTFQHLPHREHLLLTASELGATIKVWDLRAASRRTCHNPVSSLPMPNAHQRTRNYGINSMVLSTDGARLYSLCRDASVYVYSVNHVVLGTSDEMRLPPGRYQGARQSRTGLGPLYALRHPELRTGSFYIKASMRLETANQSEMLAVGSTNGCAVLFPTQEQSVMKETTDTRQLKHDHSFVVEGTKVSRSSQCLRTNIQRKKHIQGYSLRRGHSKEVTSLCWTHDGDLVTVGDDLLARCWRPERDFADKLRTQGESGGGRWGHGWADTEESD